MLIVDKEVNVLFLIVKSIRSDLLGEFTFLHGWTGAFDFDEPLSIDWTHKIERITPHIGTYVRID
ncbi:hypothetical protein, partial [Brevibacillus agri]|uniref:hypothetical protein n=1 Tax=Brevibacillus agri TaxID=51101 RepID=UPI0028681CAE